MTSQKPNFAKASLEAKRILEENFILDPPVLAYELAGNCGLKVLVGTFEDSSVAGMLDIAKKEIIVNRQDSLTRHAFTIAHELGHWILHVLTGDMKDDVEVLYRKPLGAVDDSWMEKEANWFAANLLVPSDMLHKYNTLSQDEAARLFGVSPSVIGFRRKGQNGS